MYHCWILENNEWVDVANSGDFGDAWNYLRHNHVGNQAKITGPEGEWPIRVQGYSNANQMQAIGSI